MPSVVTCPSCRRRLSVPDELANQYVQCPSCATTFQLSPEMLDPVAEAPPSPAPAAPPAEMPPAPESAPQPVFDEADDDEHAGYRPRRRRPNLKPHRGTLILVL